MPNISAGGLVNADEAEYAFWPKLSRTKGRTNAIKKTTEITLFIRLSYHNTDTGLRGNPKGASQETGIKGDNHAHSENRGVN